MMTEGQPFDYREFREKWDILLETKKYHQCEKLCHDGLAQSPPDKDRGKLYNHLGYLYENYLEDKTFDDILEHYVLSLQVDESNANSHFNLSNFLLEQGMQHLLRALELNDKHSKANKKLAQLSPMRPGSTIMIGNTRYRCVEVADDVIRCVKLRRRFAGIEEYEEVDDDPPIDLRAATPDVKVTKTISNNLGSKHVGNNSMPSFSHDPNISADNIGTGNNSNKAGAMNVEDGRLHGNSDYYQLNSNNANNGANKCGCGKPCILNVWIWIIIWFLAIAGVASPIVGYFFMNDCEDISESTRTHENVNDNDDLNILFMTDCSSSSGDSTFSQQLNSIDSMLGTLDNEGVTINNVGLAQVCDNDTSWSYDWHSYDSSLSFANTTIQDVSDLSEIYFTQMIAMCENEFSAMVANEDYSAFLCVIMVTDSPDDYYNAINFVASSDLISSMYLTFVTMNDLLYDASTYAFLGSLSYKSKNDDISWWNLTFDCDEESAISEYCQHCLYYNDSSSDTYSCNNMKMADLFVTGIMEHIASLSTLEYCTMKRYFWYAMGGAAPLLLCTFMLLLWLCKRCCCANSRSNVATTNNTNNSSSQHNSNNASQGNRKNENGNSSSQAALSAHHNHQGMQKETAYV